LPTPGGVHHEAEDGVEDLPGLLGIAIGEPFAEREAA
jgi:hypothetical protein